MLMVIPGSDISRHATLMDRVFRFRHSIFVDEKGWTVSDVHVPFAKIWRDGLQRVGATDCKSVDQRVANL